MNNVWEKVLYVFVACFFILAISSDVLIADVKVREGPKVLVVYSSESGDVDEHQRMLDLLIGHFTNKPIFKSTAEVTLEDFDLVDYVFYYGHTREVIPRETLQLIKGYDGTFVAIGHNIDQLGERYHFIKRWSDHVSIDHIIFNHKLEDILTIEKQSIFNIEVIDKENTNTLLWGNDQSERYPLFVHNQHNYYFASHLLTPPFSIPFAEALHDVFDITHEDEHQINYGYIRLEDIHPFVDPDQLMEVARLLAEKDIPYMVAVIPVYTNPITKKQYHFSDSPKLLKTLKFIQNNGGSIILHGYTHQFRLSETGEGFEFWDVEYNMPIYHDHNEEVIIKTREDFQTEKEYERYIQERKAFETKYIQNRLIRGIEELANYGLYPLALEAPHYTMSQNGYSVASDYFTTYVGQVQLSDENWEIMTTSPYITTPSFLNGMQLLPETIGYVKPEEPNAIENIISKAEDYLVVRDGIVAGFYHPYLGVERFEKLLLELENLPNITWIDLKQFHNVVKTDRVKITSDYGEIHVEINHPQLFRESFDYVDYHIKNAVTKVLWSFAGIGSLGVLSFIICLLFNSRINRSAKRGGYVG